MLSFIVHFLRLASKCLKVEALAHLAKKFPQTLYKAKKYLGGIKEKFIRYVVCPSCHSIYKFEDCIIQTPGTRRKESGVCTYIRYPNHVQHRMRAQCGVKLLKSVRSSSGSMYFKPVKTYCYQSVITGLQDVLNHPSNEQLCENWRNRNAKEGSFCDVYDGKMWNHFQYDSNGVPFLAQPYNYLLMLNCDWFQPYKHTQFSIGVLYATVENLPRTVRFKRDNVIILGVLPGPSEPSMTINSYLQPIVSDLLALWQGVVVDINGKSRTIRAAVSCIACDVPAARKVGGFVGHNAKHGCSRCLKEFVVNKFGDYPDYSGFIKAEWETRSHAVHVWYAIQHKNAGTEGERKRIETTHGVRYTHLYELPYYNAISSCVIDPMHCLFLGIAKRVFNVWISKAIITEAQLSDIQRKVDSFCCPPDIGRIPYKIAANVSGLKADEWKNWTMYFSLFALKGKLPFRDYNCWLLFVKACHLICRREVMESDLPKIDKYVEEFCITFECLYGKEWLTPNMHFAAHITECIRDHGPVYAFWLYAFERLNGLLGSYSTSHHDVTIQLMRKFTLMQDVSLSQWPEELKAEFAPLFRSCFGEKGSLSETMSIYDDKHCSIKAIPPVVEKSFDCQELDKVTALMASLYPHLSVSVLRLHTCTKAISINDSMKLASESSRYSHCSKVFIGRSLVEIISFIKCTVIVTDPSNQCSTHHHWVTHSLSYAEHPCQSWYGFPTEVWANRLNSGFNYSLLEDITSRVVFVKEKINFGRFIGEDSVVVVVPIPFYH